MYTFSLRPYCPDGAPNRCINFEQEAAAWSLSTFDKGAPILGETANFGLACYSPLTSIDISVRQLAALIAGLDKAYADLCHALYEDAPKDLKSTPWQTLDMFMQCIPRGVNDTAPEITRTIYIADAKPIPFLHNREEGVCLVWDGHIWGLLEREVDRTTYGVAGTCFGWDVLYQESSMSTDCVREPSTLCSLVLVLLETLAYLDSEEKVYVQNIFSVQ